MTSTHSGDRLPDPTADAPSSAKPPPARFRPSYGADLVVRQVEAVDLWIAARRQLERVLRSGPFTRDRRMDVDREIAVLQRVHDTIRGRCAAGLGDATEPFRTGATAVVAHRHGWFAAKVAELLRDRGVTVLACTENGAEALGAVVAEQPDLLLATERLAMLTGLDLLNEARRFAPLTLRALQPADQTPAPRAEGTADAVYPSHYSPVVLADALTALHLTNYT